MLTLSGIATQLRKPDKVVIFEYSTKPKDLFYRQQLIALLAQLRVLVEVVRPPSQESIATMYWRMLNHPGDHDAVWILNDDVVSLPDCSHELLEGLARCHQSVAVCGVKADVLNNRDYPDYTPDRVWNPETPFEKPACSSLCQKDPVYRNHVDLGNAMFSVRLFRQLFLANPFASNLTEKELRHGFEDWVFAAACHSIDVVNAFIPGAHAYHLEKPGCSRTERHALERDYTLMLLQKSFDSGYQLEGWKGLRP